MPVKYHDVRVGKQGENNLINIPVNMLPETLLPMFYFIF